MRTTLLASAAVAALLSCAALARPAAAETAPASPPLVTGITSPKAALGHEIGEDYYLADYEALVAYWKTLAKESDRVKMVDIGETSEGRRQYMMIVSSPENMKHLDRYKEIAHRLAKAEGVTPEQARAMAAEGKAVVWIDGGLHANEVEPAQALMLAVYKAVSDRDPEWMRILDDVVILLAARRRERRSRGPPPAARPPSVAPDRRR